MSDKAKKKSSSTSNMYFTDVTEQAILKYNQQTNRGIRNKIFEEEIKYPFEQIIENIYNRYYYNNYIAEEKEQIKLEALAYLVDKLDKYEKEKGAAFGYFSVITKNYFIKRNQKSYKTVKEHLYINSIPGFDLEDETITEPGDEVSDTALILREMVQYWNNHIHDHFDSKRDKKIAYAVIELVNNIDLIEHFNKKAIYIFLREMTNEKTIYITQILNKMKDVYIQQKPDILHRIDREYR